MSGQGRRAAVVSGDASERETPVCSICVANFNGAQVLRECLASVFAQDCDFPYEVIVHDDASPDGSAEIARQEFPGARLMRSSSNVGFCVANNRMVDAARGEFILLLNNDASLFPDALSRLLSAARDAREPAILGLPQFDAESGALLDRGSLLDLFFNPCPNHDPARRDVHMVMGACLWLPKQLWQDLGGFPSWFESIGEDLHLCSLARLTGRPVRVLAASGYRHHVGHSFGGGKAVQGRLVTSQRRRALSERNKSFVMVVVTPAPLIAALLPLHLIILVMEGCLLALVQRRAALLTGIYLPCLSGLWRQRRELLRQRRHWQARRSIGVVAWMSGFRLWPYKLLMLCRHGVPEVISGPK